MEPTKQNKSDAYNYVRRKVAPIFNKVAQEALKNHMPVGSGVTIKKKYCFYQPHNYRLYIQFSKVNFHPVTPHPNQGQKIKKRSVRGRLGVGYRIKNTTEHEFDNFMDCRITVKKTQVEVQNKIEPKRWFKVPITVTSREDIYKIVAKKDRQCIKVLKVFIKVYGGNSNFEILNRCSEDKIMGEDVINRLDPKWKWHMRSSKKVYNKRVIEFPGPAKAANYIEERAIDSQAPELLQGIDEVREIGVEVAKMTKCNAQTLSKVCDTMANQSKNIDYLAENINIHIPVLKRLGKETGRIASTLDRLQYPQIRLIDSIIPLVESFQDLFKPEIRMKIEQLPSVEKEKLEAWILQTFGG